MRAHRLARQRGMTLLEIMFVTLILAFLMTAAFYLANMANKRFSEGSIKHQTQTMSQKILDEIAEDFRLSAAWAYFQINNTTNPPGSGTGDTLTARLTRYDAASATTKGLGTNGAYTFGPFNAGQDAVAFLRIRGANVVGPYNGMPAYLFLDFEPSSGTLATDLGISGSGSPVNNQPGRADDDPDRRFILYRTRVKNKRIFVQRVRGIAAITNDGSATGTGSAASGLATSQEVVDVGELGPDVSDVPPGLIEIEGIDTTSPTGVGAVRIHVRANGLLGRRSNGTPEIVTTDLETYVSAPCGVPPL